MKEEKKKKHEVLKNLHIQNPRVGSPQQNVCYDFILSDKVQMNAKVYVACSLAK